jgi:hypothetical protein
VSITSPHDDQWRITAAAASSALAAVLLPDARHAAHKRAAPATLPSHGHVSDRRSSIRDL